MIIIDKPYISNELKTYLDESQHPVLKTDLSISENDSHFFNLLDDKIFADLFTTNSRLYTLSENSIEWIKNNLHDKNLIESINLLKDKFLFREKIHSLYPDFYFKKVFLNELENLKINEENFPLVLKPVVGFFSAGVYVLNSKQEYKNAVEDIKNTFNHWHKLYPTSVIGKEEFILEEYINGDEYAIDAYYDENGKAVVLNIMKHDFTSKADVSDRLYYTSKDIIEKNLELFEHYLNQINNILNIKNFPFHVEVRLDDKNEISPIEFNPLRFAGWSTTDISYFAFGFRTYDYYLKNLRPNWNALLEGKEDIIYSLIILTKPKSYAVEKKFDFEKLKNDFTKILCLRELDYLKDENPFGFLFTETPITAKSELDKIANSDLTEYLY